MSKLTLLLFVNSRPFFNIHFTSGMIYVLVNIAACIVLCFKALILIGCVVILSFAATIFFHNVSCVYRIM